METRLDKTSHHAENVLACNGKSIIKGRVEGRRERETLLSSFLRHVLPSFHLIILVCKSDSVSLRVPVSLSLSLHSTLFQSFPECSLAHSLFHGLSIYSSVFLLSFTIHPSPVMRLKAKSAKDSRMLCVCGQMCVQTQAGHTPILRSFHHLNYTRLCNVCECMCHPPDCI